MLRPVRGGASLAGFREIDVDGARRVRDGPSDGSMTVEVHEQTDGHEAALVVFRAAD